VLTAARRRAGRFRVGGTAIAVGAAVVAVGTAAIALAGEPMDGMIARSGATPIQLVGIAVMTCGALALPSSVVWSAVSRIDVALVLLAGTALMWLAPLRTIHGPSGALVDVLRGEPAITLTVVLMLTGAVMLVRCTPGGRPGIWPLTMAVIAFPAGMYNAAMGLGTANSSTVQASEVWWLIGPVLLLGAGCRAIGAERRDEARVEPEGEASGVLPALSVIVSLTCAAFHEQVMTSLDAVMMAIGVVTVMVAALRLGLLQSHQARLQDELQELAGTLADEARTDQLTGLGNRLGLEEHLGRSLADPTGHGVSLFYIDVDNFKTVNDALGHKAGDRLLVDLSVRLTDVLGSGVFRIGGDEFVAVRDDLDDERAEALAAALVAALSPPVNVDGRPVSAAASIGLARSSGGSDDADSLLRRADLALYRAKELGRARSAVYDGWLQERADRRLSLQQGLRRAIQDGEFEVRYQPVVELATGRVVAAEASVRWDTADHGLLLPDEFLPVAAEAGLVPEISAMALRASMSRLADAVLDDGTPLRLAVNLGAQEMAYGGLVEDIRTVLHGSGVDPSRIELEVTERVVMDPASAPTLDGLVALGATVTVRDFGTGSSSLRRLGRFPDPTIKVDRSFVAGLGRRSDDQLIMEAVAELATELGFTVTADGVTQEVQATELARLGADRAQGWWFGHAVPWAEFVARHLVGSGETDRAVGSVT
jgi:diguanylate cyclase (GGDEF)-like protein